MLGEALRLLRVFNDLKAKELAIDLGISPSYLSELENSKINIHHLMTLLQLPPKLIKLNVLNV